MNRTYRFLFYGRERPVRACGGGDEQGVVCELRSLPGKLVTWAPTFEEAVALMKRRLENAFEREGGLQPWYAAASEAMSQDDLALFGKTHLRPPELVKANGYEHYNVLEPAGA